MVKTYVQLMRLDKPTGIWLLLLPCWWGAALAIDPPNFVGADDWFAFAKTLLLFLAGAVVMRAAGCIVNDLWDRKIDAQVERTKNRPLASGAISKSQALLLLIILLLIGLLILLQFNTLTIALGVASLLLVVTYPLMKRMTWWPQAFLGVTFNWGILMGQSAVSGHLPLPAIVLYFSAIFWTLGYDTIYAHQDIEDDARIGVKSTALKFGSQSKRFVALSYSLFVFGLYCTGAFANLPLFYFFALLPVALHFVWQMAYWKPDNPRNCLAIFKVNALTGLLVFIVILCGKLF